MDDSNQRQNSIESQLLHPLLQCSGMSSLYIFWLYSDLFRFFLLSFQISAKLNFHNRFGCDHEQHASSIRSITSKKSFEETVKVTDIDLRIQPIRNEGVSPSKRNVTEDGAEQRILPIGEINITIEALNHILKDERNNDLEEVLHDALDDPKCFHNYLMVVVSMFRLEYTDIGVQYAVAGGFTSPVYTSFPWPEDIDCDCDGMNFTTEDNEDEGEVNIGSVDFKALMTVED